MAAEAICGFLPSLFDICLLESEEKDMRKKKNTTTGDQDTKRPGHQETRTPGNRRPGDSSTVNPSI